MIPPLLFSMALILLGVDGRLNFVPSITSSSLPLDIGFLEETLSLLQTRHLVLICHRHVDPQLAMDSLWRKSVTTEIHIDRKPLQMEGFSEIIKDGIMKPRYFVNTTDQSHRNAMWDKMQWDFLYGRANFLRSYIAVLVLGPSQWSEAVSRHMDTLLLYPLGGGGPVDAASLCREIPIGVRVAVLTQFPDGDNISKIDGLLQEAQLIDGGRYSLRSVGLWRNRNLIMLAPLLPPLKSLQGATLKTGVVKGITEVIFHEKNGRTSLDGPLGVSISAYMKKLNFTLKVIEGIGFGVLTENDSFSGVVGFVERREIDFASATLVMTPERNKVLDFTVSFGQGEGQFITKSSKIVKDPFLIFRIFQWQSWCAIGGFLILASFVLSITWNGSESVNFNRSHRRGLYQASASTILKAAVFMSSHDQPSQTSGRVVLVFSWLVIIILVSVFRGNLTAFLSIPPISHPPGTVKELNERGYRLSIAYGIAQYSKMKTSPISEHIVAFKRAEILPNTDAMLEEENLRRVQTEPLAFIGAGMTNKDFMHRLSKRVGSSMVCQSQLSSEALFSLIVGLGFLKNSPIMPLFNNLILREQNIDQFTITCLTPNLRGLKLRAIKANDVGGIFSVWAAGLLLTILVAFAEIVFASKNNDLLPNMEK